MKATRSLVVILLMLVAHVITSATNAAVIRTGTAANPTAATPGWNVVMVDNIFSSDVGRSPSIAIDPVTQRPYVSYYDAANGALRLARGNALGVGTCGSWGWNCELLDDVGRAGAASSLRFAPGGTGAYAIAYTEPDYADIKLRRVAADGAAKVQTIPYDYGAQGKGPAEGGNDQINHPALAFRDNQPFVGVYRSFRLTDVLGDTRDSGVEVLKVDEEFVEGIPQDTRSNSDENEASDHGLFAALDIDAPTNTWRVAYRERNNQTLKYAQPVADGGTGCFYANVTGQDPNKYMRCELIDPAPKTGSYITLIARHSLVGGGTNAVQIAYYDGTNGRVKYAKFVGGSSTCGAGGAVGWECVVIDNVGTHNGPMGVSMAMDSQGRPVIAYYDRNDTNHGVLKVARPVVGSEQGNCGPSGGVFPLWRCLVVDDGGLNDVGQYAALALDSDDKAYVAYFNSTEKALMVAHEKSDTVPGFTKSYSPTTIQQGGTATVTYKITNKLAHTALSGVAFTDGLVNQTFVINTLTTSNCGDAATITFPGNSIKLSNGSMGPDKQCIITVKVTSNSPGSYTDSTTPLKANEAQDAPAAVATLTVQAIPTATPIPTATLPPNATPVPTATTDSAIPTPTATTPSDPDVTPTTEMPVDPNPTNTNVPPDASATATTGLATSEHRVHLPFVQR